jgi:hypothetical protein
VFSTGESVWPGRISGKVEHKSGTQRQGQLLVALFPANGDTVPDPSTTEPIAVTEAGVDGTYRLDGLPVDGASRWIVAMIDRDGNREIGGKGEYVSADPETVALTPQSPDAEIALQLVDPETPGEIAGLLVRSEGDSLEAWVEAYETEADSLALPRARDRATDTGKFSLKRLPPGDYVLTAFCDRDGDGRRDDAEAQERWGTLRLAAAETRDVGEWPFPACSP